MYNLEKSATTDSIQICSSILDRIRDENPSYWPHGLDIPNHDEMYLIREKKANTPIGFVGLQKRTEKNDTITGYYTIGILPEYRNQGFAKIAIQTLLKAKEPEVDQFKALIMEHNTPSINLAKSLDVEAIIKQGFIKQALIENTIKDRFTNFQKNQSLKQKEQERKYEKYKKDQEKAQEAHHQKRIDLYNSVSERTQEHYQAIEDAKQDKIDKERDARLKQEQEAHKNAIKRQELEQKSQLKIQHEHHKLQTRKETDKIKRSKDFHKDIQSIISSGLDRRMKSEDRNTKQQESAQKQEQQVLIQKQEYEENLHNALPASMKRKDNLPPIKLQFKGDPTNLPMSRITVGQKKEAAGKAVNNELGKMIAGGVGGGLVSHFGINPVIFGDGVPSSIENANTLSNVILGALLAKSKNPGEALKLALPYLGAKEVAIGIGANVSNSLDRVTKSIEPAAQNLNEGAIAFKEGMKTTPLSHKLLLGLAASGLLGAGGFAIYDRFFKPKDEFEGKKDVSINIPGSKVSDHFYNNLAREMLFYTPEQKAERIAELQNDKSKKRRGFFSKNTDEVAEDEAVVDTSDNLIYYGDNNTVKAAGTINKATKPYLGSMEYDEPKDPKSLLQLKGSPAEQPDNGYGIATTIGNMAGNYVGGLVRPLTTIFQQITGQSPLSDNSIKNDANLVSADTLNFNKRLDRNLGLHWNSMKGLHNPVVNRDGDNILS